jgi:Zn-dependent M28 family amino/carboxypeptidase
MTMARARIAAALVLVCACGDANAPSGASDGGSGSASTGGGESSTGEAASESGAVATCDAVPETLAEERLWAHLEAFAQHAADHGGNRATGFPGFDASSDYVAAQLESWGYAVTVQAFDVEVFEPTGPATLQRETPMPQTFVEGTDYDVAWYSAGGSASAQLVAVDLQLGPDNDSNSGCDASDWEAFPAGAIALVQRGTCFNSAKVLAAQGAGASAVVIFNQGDSDARMGLWMTTLGADNDIALPVVLTTYAVGEALASAPASDVTVVVDAIVEPRPCENLIAERTGVDAASVRMVGAHLDSVQPGPGINDNGSGSAAVLEIARAMAECTPPQTVRFAWWGAEELGLVGSERWIEARSAEELAAISGYLNLDMVGSPNFVRFRYDGDGSAFGAGGPMGSDALEAALVAYLDGVALASEETAFDGRSDYGPFVAAGIAAGGVFTGAEGHKSDAQARTFGGTPGAAYDACYHAACDGLDNVDAEVATQLARAVAAVLVAP